MTNQNPGTGSEGPLRGWADVVVRFGLVALVVFWSFLLLLPFIEILVWAAILSVALHPFHGWLKRRLGGRSTLAAFVLTLLGLLVILGPVSALGAALVNNLSGIAAGISEGTITVPPPPPYVAEWPIIGDRLSALWETASEGLGDLLETLEPQLKSAARMLLRIIGDVGIGMLQFTAAIVIAGFTYSRAAGIQRLLKEAAVRAAPKRGEDFLDLAGGTVRSVARGVVGISLMQAILLGIGLLVAGIPLAGLWAFLALILAVVQIGPGLVIIPVIIYAWTYTDVVIAALFTAYMVPVMLMDNVLKPIVMGRGLPVPMLVIFIGVIGGTITHGLIGVFVGPIVLSLAYELVKAWIEWTRASPESKIESD